MTRKRLAFAILLAALVITASPARGEDWYVTPWIEGRVEYNSNVLYTADDELDDLVFHVRPGFSALYGSERTQWTWDTSLDGQIYADNPDLNTVEADSTAAVVRQWTDRLSTRLGLTFAKDETLDAELRESGLVARRESRYRYGPDFSFAYLMTDRVGVEGGLGLRRTDYDSRIYPDRTTWMASLSPYYLVTPRDRVGVSFGVSGSDYEDTSTIFTFTNSLFWRRDLSESSHILLSAGYRTTRTTLERDSVQIVIDPATNQVRFVTVTDEERYSDTGFIFNASWAAKLTETVSVDLSAGREQYNSVTAASNERTFVRGSVSWLLSERTTASLAAGYDYNQEEAGAGADQKTHYVRIAPGLSHRLTPRFSLQGGAVYEHSFVKYRGSDEDKDRYRIWAGLRYVWERALEK
ncbi:uncharacterized protein, PEP-CTERM system associated [Desulfacinum hydrothermale DSM 13146]|uniref:Uncharacterized protein, PEP-CTERM system associated n=1 Tax=Desulfacinum hydrothermale DSM 13146 TaxID=1121390 RepID=A0A1W1XT70_9BACT|nr:hypothetical protein [Desulfacinum hydrothermale]SMC26728.1 uncharacterized protein, PEP-CTERM system associated [Desulfacinum hydrothermale DSM 13146]